MLGKWKLGVDKPNYFGALLTDSIKLFQRFSDNQTKANDNKCHRLVSGKNDVTMNASGFKIKKNYLDFVIKKACSKINALSRVTPFMNLSKKKMLILFSSRNSVIVYWFGSVIVA